MPCQKLQPRKYPTSAYRTYATSGIVLYFIHVKMLFVPVGTIQKNQMTNHTDITYISTSINDLTKKRSVYLLSTGIQSYRMTAPHIIAPLNWASWNASSKEIESELSTFVDSDATTISSVIWDDIEDPLTLKSKPYFLHASHDGKSEVRLDLPPPTHLKQLSSNDASSFKVFRLSDFFISPEECWNDAVLSSCDPVTGKQLSLTSEQRKTLKAHGTINVPSRRFKSNVNNQVQYHTWQVARGLYSGSSTILNDFLKFGCGIALNHLFFARDSLASLLTAIQAINGSFLKVYEGLTHFLQTHNQAKYSPEAIEVLVEEAKERYIFSQCSTASSGGWMLPLQQRSSLYFEAKGDYVRELRHALLIDGEWTVGLEQSINDDWRAAKLALDRIKVLRQSMENVRPHNFANKDDGEMSRSSTRVAQLFFKKHNEMYESNQLERWIDIVRNDELLGPYAQYEVERIRAEELETLLRQEDHATSSLEAEIKLKEVCRRSPIQSLSSEWKRRELQKIQISCATKLQQTFEHRLMARLSDGKLDRMLTIRRHTNEFNAKHGISLRQKLKKMRVPLAPAIFHVLQFNPNNWANQNRHMKVAVPLNKPWWRLRHAFLAFWTATKEVIGGSYHFLFHGPLSFRALLSSQPFCAAHHDHITPTLKSRLEQFWSALSEVRRKFEDEPDSGLIGKSVARVFLRAYLMFKGLVGTTWIVTFMTIGTIFATLMATCFLLLGPLLGIFWALCGAAIQVLIFDFPLDSALRRPNNELGLGKYHTTSNNVGTYIAFSPVIKIGVIAPFLALKGVLICIFALTSCCLVHPTFAILRLAWSGFRSSLRSFRDLLTWPILSATARAPATNHDTWLAYRIHGPGLASEQYYRLPLWSAKLSVRLKLDTVRLDLHHRLRSQEFMEPYNAYASVFKDLDSLGMKCFPITESPLRLAQTISNNFFDKRKHYLLPSSAELKSVISNPQNIWEQCTYTLATKSKNVTFAKWNPLTVESVDEMISKDMNEYKAARRPSLLQRIVDSIVPTFATWLSQKRYRDFLLHESMSLPMEVSGRFRLSSQELDDLWMFTLREVDLYSNIIRIELEDIADQSKWLTKEDGTKIAAAFNDRNESNALVAYQLLCSLFGDTAMIETLEDIDEKLVLDAGIAPEDRHLLLWMDEGDGSLLPVKKRADFNV